MRKSLEDVESRSSAFHKDASNALFHKFIW